MRAVAQRYVLGLRWESRSVITFIIATCVAVFVMTFGGREFSLVVLVVLMLVGSGLAFTLKMWLRDDYLHVGRVTTVVAMIPGVALATVYVGMLGSWMQRVGFGPIMRVSVTSLMLWAVVTSALHLSLLPSVTVLTVAVATSAARACLSQSRYLVLWASACAVALVITVLSP